MREARSRGSKHQPENPHDLAAACIFIALRSLFIKIIISTLFLADLLIFHAIRHLFSLARPYYRPESGKQTLLSLKNMDLNLFLCKTKPWHHSRRTRLQSAASESCEAGIELSSPWTNGGDTNPQASLNINVSYLLDHTWSDRLFQIAKESPKIAET